MDILWNIDDVLFWDKAARIINFSVIFVITTRKQFCQSGFSASGFPDKRIFFLREKALCNMLQSFIPSRIGKTKLLTL